MPEADWWTRAGGFLLDQLIVAGVAVAGALLTAALAGDGSDVLPREVAYAVAFLLGLVYAPLLMARGGARNGQTLGKQIVGIRVVRADGTPMTFWGGVLRTVVGQQLLTAITFYLYAVLDYLWPLRDARKQALHDKIAGTYVLRATVPAAAPVRWLPPQAPGA